MKTMAIPSGSRRNRYTTPLPFDYLGLDSHCPRRVVQTRRYSDHRRHEIPNGPTFQAHKPTDSKIVQPSHPRMHRGNTRSNSRSEDVQDMTLTDSILPYEIPRQNIESQETLRVLDVSSPSPSPSEPFPNRSPLHFRNSGSSRDRRSLPQSRNGTRDTGLTLLLSPDKQNVHHTRFPGTESSQDDSLDEHYMPPRRRRSRIGHHSPVRAGPSGRADEEKRSHTRPHTSLGPNSLVRSRAVGSDIDGTQSPSHSRASIESHSSAPARNRERENGFKQHLAQPEVALKPYSSPRARPSEKNNDCRQNFSLELTPPPRTSSKQLGTLVLSSEVDLRTMRQSSPTIRPRARALTQPTKPRPLVRQNTVHEVVEGVKLDSRPRSRIEQRTGLSIPEIEARDIREIPDRLPERDGNDGFCYSPNWHYARPPPPIGAHPDYIRSISPRPVLQGREHVFVDHYSTSPDVSRQHRAQHSTSEDFEVISAVPSVSDIYFNDIHSESSEVAAEPPDIRRTRASEKQETTSSRMHQVKKLIAGIFKRLSPSRGQGPKNSKEAMQPHSDGPKRSIVTCGPTLDEPSCTNSRVWHPRG